MNITEVAKSDCRREAVTQRVLRFILVAVLTVAGSLGHGVFAQEINLLHVNNGNGETRHIDIRTYNRITFDDDGATFSNRDEEKVDVIKILYDNIKNFTFGEDSQTTGFEDYADIKETKELIYNPETKTLTVGEIANEGAVGVYTVAGTAAAIQKVSAGSVITLDGLAPGVYVIFLADTATPTATPKTLKIKI